VTKYPGLSMDTISWEKIFEEIEITEVPKEMKMFNSILN